MSTAAVAKPKRSDPYKSEKIAGFLFVLPLVVGFLAFNIYPMVASVYLGFTNYNLYEPAKFIGLQNYANLINDTRFWLVMRNTVVYMLGNVPLQMIFAFILASLLNNKVPGVYWYRTAFFIPVVTSWVAAGVALKWILAKDVGLLNQFLGYFRIPGPGWLMEPGWAMISIILANLWKGVGFNTMLFLAGLQDIPSEIHDACEVDGTTRVQKAFRITIPLLRPTTFFVSTLAIINSFQVFDNIYVMTGGGPMDSTRVIVYHLWQTGFMFLRMGEASAIAWFLFALIFIVTFFRWRTSEGGGARA
jgi:multiple sugar transport system permease protein